MARAWSPVEERVLYVAPMPRDAHLVRRILSSVGVATEQAADVTELCDELAKGVGAAIIAEEALSPPATERLGRTLSAQPAWSDIPVLVVAGAKSVAGSGGLLAPHLAAIGNVTVLPRPLRMLSLVSAVTGALRARKRQYDLHAILQAREEEVHQRDEFLAMLGHELRNPLAAISAAAQAMARTGTQVFERERIAIMRQTVHLGRLVDDLLDVARLTNGKLALKTSGVGLRDVVNQVLKSMEGLAASHKLVVELTEEPVPVTGDAHRLEQILSNLLSNALKYTAPGGTIRVALEREGGDAVLTVEDTGVGIEPDLLPKVFDIFVQADRSLDRAEGGLGLGLALVHRLVTMHEGDIRAYSDGAGRGARFIVRLPVDGHVRAKQSAFDFGQRKPSPRRIVIVEDNEDFREALVATLEDGGHLVSSAGDGVTGLQLLVESQPDVAILDIGLPGMNGYDVARKAREVFGASIRLIALTGYGQPEDRDRAMEAGFDAHLTKPLDFSKLQPLLVATPAPASARA